MKIKSLFSSLSLLMLLPVNLAIAYDDDRNANLPNLYDENRRTVQGQQWDGRGYRGNYYSNRWGSSSNNSDQSYQGGYNYVPQYDSSSFSQGYQGYGSPDDGGFGFSESR